MSPLQEEILALKKKKNAVILAHNYQVRSIQDVADYVGDSLGLSYQAQASKADIILFCGVHFMAETAKIVNPDKKVLLPDMDAGCSLAESCDSAELAAYKERHPGVYIVAYINCTAEVKALSDVICTSGNAERMVQHVPADREILFVPDQSLGDRKSTRLNSSHANISYAVFCLKKKKKIKTLMTLKTYQYLKSTIIS